MHDKKVKETLDVTGDVCPITFVKTKLKLEQLNTGDILEVILKEGEPAENVPRNVKELGHKILDLTREGSNYRLLIEKGQ